MCTGMEALAIGAMAGTTASSLMAPDMPTPVIPKPTEPPKAAKAPERASSAFNNRAAAGPGGAMSGNSGTFLTGPSGVDASALTLGRNTLLGQ